jgi:hypothetical protein
VGQHEAALLRHAPGTLTRGWHTGTVALARACAFAQATKVLKFELLDRIILGTGSSGRTLHVV